LDILTSLLDRDRPIRAGLITHSASDALVLLKTFRIVVAFGVDLLGETDDFLRTGGNAQATTLAVIRIYRHSWHGRSPYLLLIVLSVIKLQGRYFCQTISLFRLFQDPETVLLTSGFKLLCHKLYLMNGRVSGRLAQEFAIQTDRAIVKKYLLTKNGVL